MHFSIALLNCKVKNAADWKGQWRKHVCRIGRWMPGLFNRQLLCQGDVRAVFAGYSAVANILEKVEQFNGSVCKRKTKTEEVQEERKEIT